MSLKETDVQAAICDYLALRNRFFWRSNYFPRFDRSKAIFYKLPKYTPRGIPDIICIAGGTPYFLEVKKPGGKLSADQEEFCVRARTAGARYEVVHSIEEVRALGL